MEISVVDTTGNFEGALEREEAKLFARLTERERGCVLVGIGGGSLVCVFVGVLDGAGQKTEERNQKEKTSTKKRKTISPHPMQESFAHQEGGGQQS